MGILRFRGVAVEVDEHGFLVEPGCWTDEVALALASTEGLAALVDDHWRVIHVIREHFEREGQAPRIRDLCARTELALAAIYRLFPSGPARGACKVAGLPRPDGCV